MANPPLRGQVVAHLGRGEPDGSVEVLGINREPVLDDLARGEGFIQCPGQRKAWQKENQGQGYRTQDHPLRDTPPW